MLRTPRLSAALEFNRGMAQMRRRSWPSLQERCEVCNDLNAPAGTYDKDKFVDLEKIKEPNLLQRPKEFWGCPLKKVVDAAASGCHTCCILIKARIMVDSDLKRDECERRDRECIAWPIWALFGRNSGRNKSLKDSEGERDRFELRREKDGSLNIRCWTDSTGIDLLIHTRYDESSFREFISPRGPNDNFELQYVTSRTKAWMQKCSAEHSVCGRRNPSSLPKRVLYIPSDTELRIYESRPGEREDYCALSYCWGGEQATKTTKATLSSNLAGIPINSLSPTVRDAILVTRSLGFKYLWVDALCIIQDEKQDWNDEASKMCEVYRGASLTIFASHSESANLGFLTKPPNETLNLRGIASSGKFLNVICRREWKHPDFSGDLFPRHGFSNPVYSRGWCFQERLLSYRSLHFTKKELVWECQEDTWCECGARGEILGPGIWAPYMSPSDPVISYYAWHKIAMEYNRLYFTYESDKLPALSGITQYFEDAGMGQILAGVWLDDIPQGLLWHSDQRYGLTSASPIPYQPTWSWTSLHGTIKFVPDVREDRVQFQSELQDFQATWPAVDDIGAAKDASITITALSIPAVSYWPWHITFSRVKGDSYPPYFQRGSSKAKFHPNIQPTYGCCLCPEEHDETYDFCDLDSRDIGFLLLYSEKDHDREVGLVVEPSIRRPGSFERIGLFENVNWDSKASFFDGAILGTFTLV